MLDVLNVFSIFACFAALAWIGWTANRTILNFNRQQTVGDWLALLPGVALLGVISAAMLVVNRIANGR
jgi:hypothetical protein